MACSFLLNIVIFWYMIKEKAWRINMSDRNNKGSKLLETLVRKKIIITIIIAIVFMVLSFVIPLIYRGGISSNKI